ncbi:uncharacterized protein BJX67DRAFT_381373 [Aspergillus lucknowensis]|uniref:Uncharacterized protein n=1 Tax=Aspergillus lucknowensis TaxID=176173 RepID=A0ABR4LRB5_9EURO
MFFASGLIDGFGNCAWRLICSVELLSNVFVEPFTKDVYTEGGIIKIARYFQGSRSPILDVSAALYLIAEPVGRLLQVVTEYTQGKMYLSKTVLPVALLATTTLSLSLPLEDSGAGLIGDILTALDPATESGSDSSPETSYTVNPTVVQTQPTITSATAGSSPTTSPGPGSETPTTPTTSATPSTTPIPTDILTAPDSDNTGLGPMSTVIETATVHRPQGSSTGGASPTPTDDAANAVFGNPVSMLGALLLSLAVPLF